MTGIACDGSSYTYVLGEDYYDEVLIEYFDSSGNEGTYPYMEDLKALNTHHDIAYEGGNGDGDIWVANDGEDSPIKAYDTNDELVDYVPGSHLPAGAEIRGLSFDSDRYLWASDYNAEKIYKIDLTTGVSTEEAHPVDRVELRVSSNPVYGSVAISVEGATEPVDLAVFDMAGRAVARDRLDGGNSYIWEGNTVPSGIYLIRATTSSGRVMSRLVTRI